MIGYVTLGTNDLPRAVAIMRQILDALPERRQLHLDELGRREPVH